MSMQALTIRIAADASGAISVISQTTSAVNNLGSTSSNTNRNVASLAGGVQNLGRWSGQTTSATASLTGGVNGLSRATLDAVNGTNRLNQSLAENTRVANAAAGANEKLHQSNTAVAGSFSVLKSLIPQLGLAYAIREILQANIEMEAMRNRLEAVTGSVNLAKIAFANVVQIAKETPQSIEQIGRAYIMLKNFGIEPTMQTMRDLTNVTSKLGGQSDTLTGITLALGQATAKGKLQAQDTNQMIERGVPVYGLLVQVLGKTTGEIVKMMEAGELNTEVIKKMIRAAGEWSSGSSEKMMDTLGGKVNMFGDALTKFKDAVLQDSSEGVLKQTIAGYTLFFDRLADLMNKPVIEKQIDGLSVKINALSDMKIKSPEMFSFGDREKQLNNLIAERNKLFLEQAKGLNEVANSEKILKDNEEAKLKATQSAFDKSLANGDEDALKKYMTGKLDAISEINKKIIQTEADIAGIPAKLATAIVAVESTGKIDALNKGSGAAGLMQVMPANYQKQGYTQAQMLSDASIGVRSGLKVYQDSLNEAKNEVKKGVIEVSQVIDYANALYTTKHKTIAERIAKNGGVFDMALMPKATQDWSNKFNAALALQNTTVAESGKFAQRAAKEMTDAAKQQEQAAKKIADEHKRIVNDAPVMKLQEEISKLNAQSKAGVLGNESYQYQLSKLFETYENAAFGAKEFSQEQEKIDRLMTAIATPSEKFMESMMPYIDLFRQGKIEMADFTKASLYFQAQMNKPEENLTKKYNKEGRTGYDNEIEALRKMQRELASTEDEMYRFDLVNRKTSDGLHQLFSDKQIDQIMKMHDEVKSLKFIDDMGLSNRKLANSFSTMFSQVLTEGKSFSDSFRGMMHGMINSVSSKLMDSGMSSIMSGNFIVGGASMAAGIGVGLLSSLFKDKTIDTRLADSKTEGTVLGGGSSNSIQNVVKTLNDIHAKEYKELQGINDNFALLAKGVDNTVNRAIALHGSFTPSTNGMTSTNKSPIGSVGTNAAFIAAGGALGAVTGGGLLGAGLGAMTGVGAGTVAGGVGFAAGASSMVGAQLAGGAILGVAGGLILAGAMYGLGKLLGIGKTKYTAIGNGIVTNAVEYTTEGAQQALAAYDYSTIQAKTKGWISDTTKIYDVINGIDSQMSDAFGQVFGQLNKTLFSAFEDSGILDLVNKNYTLPSLKIDLSKAKTPDEISKVITGVINTMSDSIATELAGGLFSRFQKSGEGMLQTIGRVASESVVVAGQFRKLGIETKTSGMASLEFSQTMVNLYESMPNANDGLKNFTASINEFYNAVFSAEEKTAFALSDWERYAKDFNDTFTSPASGQYISGINPLNLDPLKVSSSELKKALDLTHKAAADAATSLALLTSKGQTVADATAPITTTGLGEKLTRSLFDSILGTSDYSTASWEKLGGGWTEASIRAMDGKLYNGINLWGELIKLLDNQRAKMTAAKDKLGVDFDVNSFGSSVDAANAIAVNTGKAEKAVIGTGGMKAVLNDFSDKISQMDISAFGKLNTANEALLKTRAKEIEQLKLYDKVTDENGNTIDKVRDISSKLTPSVKDAFWEWNKGTKEIIDGAEISTAAFQEFVWSLEDTQSALKKLADATKFFDSVTQNIKSWIQNLKATQLGSPESQFNAAKDNFAAQMKIIDGGLATSAEQKQAALSGITGVADTYIAAIRSNYASTKEGQELINQVVEQVSGLTTTVDVQQLQLGVLQQIREGVHALPTGISDTQKTFFESLATKIDAAQAAYLAAPTAQNDLYANTLTKEWTMAVDYAQKGSGFLDAYIRSFDGATGLDAAVNLIFSDKSLNPVQAQTAIDNVLSKVISLVNIEVVPHFLTTVAQREIDKQIALLNPPPIYLSIDTTSAIADIQTVTNSAIDTIKIVNSLSDLSSLTAVKADYNVPEMLQTVTSQLMQSSPFTVEPKQGGGIPTDSPILKRLSSVNSSSNDSSVDMKETVDELKKNTAKLEELVKQTTALLKLQMAANQELIDKMNSMDESLKTTAKKTRLSAAGSA